MVHDPVAVVRRWFDVLWNERNAAVIDELLTADSVCHSDEGPLRGPDGFRAKQYEPLVTAFPDLKVSLEGVLRDGDEVVVRWSAEGVHTGDALGIKATNRPVTFRGMTWIRVKDGKMSEGWQSSNIVEVFRQLGAA
jgi:steroid delta-isomerase-like uncharacterized protein